MGCGKKVTFPIGNGQFRTGIHYSPSKKNKEEEDHTHPEEEKEESKTKPKSVWSKPKYDTEKYDGYIESLMGKEKEQKPNSNKEIFNKDITASWGALQTGFPSEAHNYSAEELSSLLSSEVATERIDDLNERARSDIEESYKQTNKIALSDRDNTEQRVIDAFLKGEGLGKITINGKSYNALIFDKNSAQSKELENSDIFNKYFDNYLSSMKTIINEANDNKEFDIKTLSNKLKDELGKPNFSDISTIRTNDYYGLMGGVQKVTVDFKITPISENEYSLGTTMYLTDWYGADSDDISTEIDMRKVTSNIKNIASNTLDAASYASHTPLIPVLLPSNVRNIYSNIKSLPSSVKSAAASFKSRIPGLQEFFWLQHHYGCEPFATQIIYQSEDKIVLSK